MKIQILVVVVSLALTAACGSKNPVAPTPVAQLHWPVLHSDGAYGHEDQRYAPTAEQCPVGYNPFYNGHNFVCEDYMGNREMPRKEGWSR